MQGRHLPETLANIADGSAPDRAELPDETTMTRHGRQSQCRHDSKRNPNTRLMGPRLTRSSPAFGHTDDIWCRKAHMLTSAAAHVKPAVSRGQPGKPELRRSSSPTSAGHNATLRRYEYSTNGIRRKARQPSCPPTGSAGNQLREPQSIQGRPN